MDSKPAPPPNAIAYSPADAATVTGRSRSRIFKAIKNEELTARKDGKATVIEDDELRRWVRTFPTVGRPVAAAHVAAFVATNAPVAPRPGGRT